MASNITVSSTTPISNSSFVVSDIVKHISDSFTTTPGNVLQPIYDCNNTPKYTKTDIDIIDAQLHQILMESSTFESLRLFKRAVVYNKIYKKLKCVGVDWFFANNTFIAQLQQFIKYYYSVKDLEILAANIDGDPDYYNV